MKRIANVELSGQQSSLVPEPDLMQLTLPIHQAPMDLLLHCHYCTSSRKLQWPFGGVPPWPGGLGLPAGVPTHAKGLVQLAGTCLREVSIIGRHARLSHAVLGVTSAAVVRLSWRERAIDGALTVDVEPLRRQAC